MTSRLDHRTRSLLLSAALSLAACQAAWADATSSVPPTTDPSPAIPSKEAAQQLTAIKIAGLVAFVANACPKLKTDYKRFKAIIQSLGVDQQDLDKQEMKNRYLSYTASYQQNAAASCEKAAAQFGPKGTTVPDLFAIQ